MPEVAHVASGKVREIYALDDERLLLVATDRDPGQGPRPHRAVRLLVRAHEAHRPEPPAGVAGRRPFDRVPPPGDASRGMRRPRVHHRFGLEGLPRERRGVRAPATRGPAGIAALA